MLQVEPGQAVAIRPGTPHDYGVDDGGPTMGVFAAFHARPHWLEWLNWPAVSRGLMHLVIDDPGVLRRVTASLRRAAKLVELPTPLRHDLAMNAVEQALLWCCLANPRGAGSLLDPRVRQAVEYLSNNLAQPISVTRLAAACHVSASHLFPLFREQVGTTPIKFLERQRMARAMKLLRTTNDPIQDIAAAVGIADAFYFSARFKKQVGQSPRAYRRGGEDER
jgi:AraC family transcriptional regulator of arabinose operon